MMNRSLNIVDKGQLKHSVDIALRDFFQKKGFGIVPETREKLAELVNRRWESYLDNKLERIEKLVSKRFDKIQELILSLIDEIGKHCYELGKENKEFEMDSLVIQLREKYSKYDRSK